jgi:hypothetical protein
MAAGFCGQRAAVRSAHSFNQLKFGLDPHQPAVEIRITFRESFYLGRQRFHAVFDQHDLAIAATASRAQLTGLCSCVLEHGRRARWFHPDS